jgi:uncharacterized Zn finger protein
MQQLGDDMIERAREILEQGRVALVSGWEERVAVVCGRTGWYTVRAYRDGLQCECKAAGAEWCSHRVAAAVVFAEATETPFGRVA